MKKHRTEKSQSYAWKCQWQARKCNEESTHFHHAYGELCPLHAVEVIKAGEKVKRI